jgi:hypothetical protein
MLIGLLQREAQSGLRARKDAPLSLREILAEYWHMGVRLEGNKRANTREKEV